MSDSFEQPNPNEAVESVASGTGCGCVIDWMKNKLDRTTCDYARVREERDDYKNHFEAAAKQMGEFRQERDSLRNDLDKASRHHQESIAFYEGHTVKLQNERNDYHRKWQAAHLLVLSQHDQIKDLERQLATVVDRKLILEGRLENADD